MRTILAEVVRFFVRSKHGMWVAVVGTTILLGLFNYLLSSWSLGVHSPEVHSALQATIVGLGAGFTVWLFLAGLAERRRDLEDEMRRVAELNLSVRNSLELIVLVHHEAKDGEHKRMVMECTAQIDRTLRELFPVISEKIGSETAKGTGRRRNWLDRTS